MLSDYVLLGGVLLLVVFGTILMRRCATRVDQAVYAVRREIDSLRAFIESK
ncbi:MAG TPA: hypothetical protein VGX03_15065 [Candidatus Binatia bacterium]|jgi:hypothetical protein|nr:hypothetical protein [Candidatus Binatia bacterium]